MLLDSKPVGKMRIHILRTSAHVVLNVGISLVLSPAFEGNHLVVGVLQSARFDALQLLSGNPLRTGYILFWFHQGWEN